MRYERKFVFSGMGEQHLNMLIRLHPAGFFDVYPPRQVNNLYLDSLTLQNYHESIDGVRDRTKIRIRWYGELRGRVPAPCLEFKIKRGLLGFKKQFDLAPFTIGDTVDREVVRQLLQQTELPIDLAVAARSAELSLMNSYNRAYYVSRDGRFRLTVDTNLKYYGLHRLRNHLMASSLDKDNTVVELKYDQEDDEAAQAITRHLPLRLTRNSKYAAGLERLYW